MSASPLGFVASEWGVIRKFIFQMMSWVSAGMPAGETAPVINNIDDHIWLTYDEAAQALGIKADSVRRRAAARKWPKRPGNDRTVRVGIPRDAIPAHTPDATHDTIRDVTPDYTDAIRSDLAETKIALAASEAEVSGLRDRLADTQAERDRLAALLNRALEHRPAVSIWGKLFGR